MLCVFGAAMYEFQYIGAENESSTNSSVLDDIYVSAPSFLFIPCHPSMPRQSLNPLTLPMSVSPISHSNKLKGW